MDLAGADTQGRRVQGAGLTERPRQVLHDEATRYVDRTHCVPLSASPIGSDLRGNLKLPAVGTGQRDDEDAKSQFLERGTEANPDEQRGQLRDDQRAHDGPLVSATAAE